MAFPDDPEPEGEPMTFDGEDADTRTGHGRIDAAIERLRTVDELPVEEHAAVYGEVHDELRASLTEAGMPADGSGSAS